MAPSEESYRLIPLSQKQFAIVDTEDFEWLSKWRWHALWNPCTNSFYAARNIALPGRDRKFVKFRMHRVILGLEHGDKRQGDHMDGNTLNNRRSNLRIATPQENNWNRSLRKTSLTGIKGVTWDKRSEKWMAQIWIDGKNVKLGRFATAKEAQRAYQLRAEEAFGDFLRQ